MPGSGKSIFCLQALCNNAVRGKNCLFISFEESVEDLHDQMKEFNWAFNGVDGHLKIVSWDAEDPKVLDKIEKEVKEKKYDLIALDSLASLAAGPSELENQAKYSLEEIAETVYPIPLDAESLHRLKVKTIIRALKKSNATVLMTSETLKEEGSRFWVGIFLAAEAFLTSALQKRKQ